MFLGLPAGDESEGFDRTHMDLPANQIELLRRVATANPNLVVILANGSAVRVSPWEHHTKALLECWLSGQAAGGAAADLLLGSANPSGRLSEIIPIRLQDNSAYLNFPGDSGQVRYGEGIFVCYRGYDATDTLVSHPFGHGMSYTTFDYTDLSLSTTGCHDTGDLEITVFCQVRNAGECAGKEVVQLYVADVDASVARPKRELRAFSKIHLQPSAGCTVVFTLRSRDLSYWTEGHGWTLEAGKFELNVGASSRDLRLSIRISVEAAARVEPLGLMSSLDEWLADPVYSAALHDAVGNDDTGRPKGILGDPDHIKIAGNFPVSTLAAFSGFGFDF